MSLVRALDAQFLQLGGPRASLAGGNPKHGAGGAATGILEEDGGEVQRLRRDSYGNPVIIGLNGKRLSSRSWTRPWWYEWVEGLLLGGSLLFIFAAFEKFWMWVTGL